MSLKETATRILEILNAGYFLTPDGQRVNIEPALSKSVGSRRLWQVDESPTFTGAFDRVVFAICDKPREQSTLSAFKRRFLN